MGYYNCSSPLKYFKNIKSSSSLMQRYLKGGMKTRGYDILSSMSSDQSRQKKTTAVTPTIEQFEYEVHPLNTSISLKKKMNYLQDLECQDVEEWVDQYRTLM
ncbi:hypothetical protein H312_00034 [Anncaliia algerae PRA339]|uniref:Uncharacterized protein n=1 Tax=Anncaliia algerae PRA339 TaxID=1288291 RepID=A0A059F5X0_9MICR|nr:hypothetical protein H312_00034 [Anncaliia algerae PRA339]